MAHFAELDDENLVKRVIVVNNSDCVKDSIKVSHPTLMTKSVSGAVTQVGQELVSWEDDLKGIAFCEKLLGGRWVKTSYNGNTRKHYAGIGYKYDPDMDAFIPPQPYKSWTLDKEANWQPPVQNPHDGKMYSWSEDKQTWEVIE